MKKTWIICICIAIFIVLIVIASVSYSYSLYANPQTCNVCKPITGNINGEYKSLSVLADSTTKYVNSNFKVLTFNMNSELFLVDANFGTRDIRFQSMIYWIKKNKPDVLLLQEVPNYRRASSIVQSLCLALGDYNCHQSLDMGLPFVISDGNAIMVHQKHIIRHPMVEILHYSSPGIGDYTNWILSTGANCNVIGLEIFPDGCSRDPIYVYTTHLLENISTSLQSVRLDQIKCAIKKHITSSQDLCLDEQQLIFSSDHNNWNIIFGGDFNLVPTEQTLQDFLSSTSFQDVWMETDHSMQPNSTGITFAADVHSILYNPCIYGANQFPDQSNSPATNTRIDYIFHTGPLFNAQESTVVMQKPIQHAFMSDHWGVFASFSTTKTPQLTAISIDESEMISVPSYFLQLPCATNDNNNFQVSTKGLTVQNIGSSPIYIEVFGSGSVFCSNNLTLTSNSFASFWFITEGPYTLVYSVDSKKTHIEIPFYFQN